MRIAPAEFKRLYAQFHMPVTAFDCGDKCSPYHPNNIPYCCDSKNVIPSAYQSEWQYLKTHTQQWKPWDHSESPDAKELLQELPAGQLLIKCRGYTKCDREFRAICCRSFPFFPYLDQYKFFIGIAYYWEHANFCWLVSNLPSINQEYLNSFFRIYDHLFKLYPEEIDNFYEYSKMMRDKFNKMHRKIIIFHRYHEQNIHHIYEISPYDGSMKPKNASALPKFGPYKIADTLTFANEE